MPIYYGQSNQAGYATLAQRGLPPIPWFYRGVAGPAPGQVASWLSPTLASYLPPVWSLKHA